MNWFVIIQMFYKDNLWNKAQVWDAVLMNKITQEQYSEIVGEPYPEERPEVA